VVNFKICSNLQKNGTQGVGNVKIGLKLAEKRYSNRKMELEVWIMSKTVKNLQKNCIRSAKNVKITLKLAETRY
jgi:hypothetical protein